METDAHPTGAGAYGVSAFGPLGSRPGPIPRSCRRPCGRGLCEVCTLATLMAGVETARVETAGAEIMAPA